MPWSPQHLGNSSSGQILVSFDMITEFTEFRIYRISKFMQNFLMCFFFFFCCESPVLPHYKGVLMDSYLVNVRATEEHWIPSVHSIHTAVKRSGIFLIQISAELQCPCENGYKIKTEYNFIFNFVEILMTFLREGWFSKALLFNSHKSIFHWFSHLLDVAQWWGQSAHFPFSYSCT